MRLAKTVLSTLALVAASTSYGQTLVSETFTFDDGNDLTGWNVVTGGASVDVVNERLVIDHGTILELPIDPGIDRAHGDIEIVVEGVSLHSVSGNQCYADFDIWAFYEYPVASYSDDGYFFTFRPTCLDDGWLDGPTQVQGNGESDYSSIGMNFSGTATARINSDGTVIAEVINQDLDTDQVEISDNTWTSGKIALRTWGKAWVDTVTVSYTIAVADTDGDGIGDELDFCPDTLAGATVGATGCSGVQEVTEACPVDGDYRNHGDYVSCTSHAVEEAVADLLLTEAEGEAIVSAAGQSDIGKKEKSNKGGNGKGKNS